MDPDEGPADHEVILGLPVDRAVEVVVDRNEAVRPAEARSSLEAVSEDGVVTRDGIDDAIAHLSKVVSTPETRLELAEIELADARETADPVADLAVVEDRLGSFEARIEAIREGVEALGGDLRTLVDQRGETAEVYETASEIRRLTEAANRLQRAADELQVALDEFETWVANPDRRIESFEGDVDALADGLDTLSEAIDALVPATNRAAGGGDPAREWFDATVRWQVLGVVVEDLGWELEELRRWAAREPEADPDALDGLPGRLDELRDRRATLEERLDGLARREWRYHFDGRLAAVEGTIEDVEPPVDWNALEAAIDVHRSDGSRPADG